MLRRHQLRTARAFISKYQDRLMFEKDAYFDYYRDYHAFWKMYGMGLPDSVLQKVYYQNALKITPAIPRGEFPRWARSTT